MFRVGALDVVRSTGFGALRLHGVLTACFQHENPVCRGAKLEPQGARNSLRLRFRVKRLGFRVISNGRKKNSTPNCRPEADSWSSRWPCPAHARRECSGRRRLRQCAHPSRRVDRLRPLHPHQHSMPVPGQCEPSGHR